MAKIFRSLILWQVVCIALVVVMVGYPFAPVLTGADTDVPKEKTRITDYQAEFNVNQDGDMRVTEKLEVDFPDEYSHGIFRFFDRHDPNAPGLRRVPRDFTAQVDPGLSLDERLERVLINLPYAEDEIADARARDDQEALEQIADDWYPDYGQVTKSDESWGRYTNVRVGSEHDTLPAGKHVYILEYDMPDVLLEHQNGARFNWNLIPSGWNQAIDDATLTVNLPGTASGLKCTAGNDPCDTASGDATTTVTVTASNLKPRTPVTISANVNAEPSVVDYSLPWPVHWDPILGDHEDTTYLILGLAVLGLIAGLWLSLRSRDPIDATTTSPSPPTDVGPAQAAYLFTKRLSSSLATATIFHAAARGTITMEQHDKTVTLRPASSASYSGLDDITRNLALWVKSKPRRIDASSKEGRKSGKWLTKQNGRIAEWADKNGYLVKDRWWTVRLITILIATVASVVLAAVRPHGTIDALPTALFAMSAIYSIRPSAKLRRTAAGKKLANSLAHVRTVITDPSPNHNARSRFNDYLPWAVALACTAQWTSSSQALHGSHVPHWLNAQSPNDVDVGSVITATTSAYESTVSSSIRAYVDSFSSTSSGGGSNHSGGIDAGGGSVGGGFSGGGDGGGGSW